MSKKRIQNYAAESRKALPIATIYGIGIWLLAGLVNQGWWLQFACFAASVYAVFQLNNLNLMIRVYSRSVSVAYILLSCITVWLFPSVHGAIIQLGITLILLLLFASYQDRESRGKTFYMFTLVSLISLVEPYFLLFVPAIWLLMATTIFSLTTRTFLTSIVGLLTPYWLYFGVKLAQNPLNPEATTSILSHFDDIQLNIDYGALTIPQLIYLGLLVVMFMTGAIHFWITSYMDKIRVRQIYYSMIILAVYTMALIAIQPQMYNVLIYMLTITVSPIIAHFMTFTRTWLSNAFFLIVMAVIVILTGMNLWVSL